MSQNGYRRGRGSLVLPWAGLKAASKLAKSLLEAVNNLKEAGEEAAEKRWA